MIRYRLRCIEGHAFDEWFQNAAACDVQLSDASLACPDCGSTSIVKGIMAPSVAKPASVATPCGKPVCGCGCPALDA